MGKSQQDKSAQVSSPNKKSTQDTSSDNPPQIPPRMKKKGPALPVKPMHMRAKSSPNLSSQQPTREPLRPRILPSNTDTRQTTQREILVAASRAVREKPVEKRQREPAKLLMPTFGDSNRGGTILRKDVQLVPPKKTSNEVALQSSRSKKEVACVPSKIIDDQALLKSRKDLFLLPSATEEGVLVPFQKIDSSRSRKGKQQQGPLLLIPRASMSWGSLVSFALWPQRDPPSKGGCREMTRFLPSEKHPASFARSGSVTRSGSLTSQGSSDSSGNETFPKSVLKKQKRIQSTTASKNTSSKNSGKKVEQKKNVTFNAFATVQLMEE